MSHGRLDSDSASRTPRRLLETDEATVNLMTAVELREFVTSARADAEVQRASTGVPSHPRKEKALHVLAS